MASSRPLTCRDHEPRVRLRLPTRGRPPGSGAILRRSPRTFAAFRASSAMGGVRPANGARTTRKVPGSKHESARACAAAVSCSVSPMPRNREPPRGRPLRESPRCCLRRRPLWAAGQRGFLKGLASCPCLEVLHALPIRLHDVTIAPNRSQNLVPYEAWQFGD